MEWNKSRKTSFLLLFIIICIFSLFSSKYFFSFQWSIDHQYIQNFFLSIENISNDTLKNSTNDSIKSDVLLIYVYAENHQYAYGNLKYFIDNAVREDDGVDYVFILQQIHNKEIDESEMPSIPRTNAIYLQHENKCFDYGTIGWFFAKYTIGNPWRDERSILNHSDYRRFNLTQYQYFIFMNSSIRGPFFPPYFLKFLSDYEKDFHQKFYWYYLFTKRINEKIKLVGSTISCTVPKHVQSYFLTTDFVGLSVLLKSGGSDGSERPGVFGCYSSLQETIWLSEMGISKRILDADYMMDCLLTKYQTMEFSKESKFCPIDGNPYMDKNMDGVSLEPYEVVFVKYNGKISTTDALERAKVYQRWMEQTKTENRTGW